MSWSKSFSSLLHQSSDPQAQCLAAPQTPVTSYKQRFDEFRKLFKELPESERLVAGELKKLLHVMCIVIAGIEVFIV